MRVGGARPSPFTILSAITYKFVVFAPAERADTLPLFLLYPLMYSVEYTGFKESTWNMSSIAFALRNMLKSSHGRIPLPPQFT